MDIYEHRRNRLRDLINSKFHGRDVDFAKHCENSDAKMNATRISQFLSLKYRGGRSLTEKAARALEIAAKLYPMYLDENFAPISGFGNHSEPYIETEEEKAEKENQEKDLLEVEEGILKQVRSLNTLHPNSILAELILDFDRLDRDRKIQAFQFVATLLHEQSIGLAERMRKE